MGAIWINWYQKKRWLKNDAVKEKHYFWDPEKKIPPKTEKIETTRFG